MTTFKQFSDHAIKASPLLTDDEIAILLRDNLQEPLQRYLFRIAAYAVNEIKQAEIAVHDDEDYIDACLECVTIFPKILRTYKQDRDRLSTFAQESFRRAAVRYLAVCDRGGMAGTGRWLDSVPPTLSLEDMSPTHDEDGNESDDTWDDFTAYDGPPMGYGDPLEELIRHETAKDAIKFASKRASTRAEATRLSHEIGRYNK